ncbi:NAD(P)/FAD-dependent oxidoreductase [Nocardia sp. NBC_01329]|uniref:NAD(P)/FAD-dependent oxidoreductase n=1 Tax=Nocardia sp. NBC_01329 TaxID=2903594 RepID=UPI002E117E77|nr:NAD(P)/FAD-dependent oxidoreductase [Nocardia sp. NBC_01329]
MTEQLENDYDVVVAGGGAAGLNGALMLARSRRRVVVIDAGQPRNAPADAVHGLLARDGTPPAELLETGRAEVRRYGGQVVSGRIIAAVRDGAGFAITLADGRAVRARRLLVTTGLTDELPDIPGLRERWGRDVLHCPYCHGWEVRDRAIAVLSRGPVSMHQVQLFRQLSDDVVYFTHDQPDPTPDAAERLAARGVRVVSGKVTGIETTDDRITGIRLADGTVVARDAIAVGTHMVARSEFLDSLGLVAIEHPGGFGRYLPSDATGRTEVPGVWAAGNVTDLPAQVGAAAAAGATAGAQINADLVEEEFDIAVATHRAGFTAAGEAELAESVNGSRGHGL